MKTQFVVGFMFSSDHRRVALIRKTHPDWQAGKLNGIGGHIEPGESPWDAMNREFREEAGVDWATEFWERFLTVEYEAATIRFYRTFSDNIDRLRSVTDELIEVVDSFALPGDVIPNLRWIVPFALDLEDRFHASTLVRSHR